MPFQSELQLAIDAVRKASALCKRVQENLIDSDTVQKNDKSPVTIADLGTQAVVNIAIRQQFPDAAMIGEEDSKVLRENPGLSAKVVELVREIHPGIEEEAVFSAIDFGSAQDTGGRFWTLDPIDGTKGFLRGDQYAIALALVEEGQVVMGVLGCPNYPLEPDNPLNKGALFYAVKGEGACELPLGGGAERKITTDGQADPAQARFCESVEAAHASHDTHARIGEMVGISAPPYRIDSQCKYAAVARGDASIYLRLPRNLVYREKIWDHAAGVIVVAEAGGRISDFSGNPLNFGRGSRLEDNVGILVSNGPLHGKTLEAIEQVVDLGE
ncbi:MAG TPA: 3'(2'),5'-bisphosphate nucleotidase [Calditrichia bacterium]|nr:3'(2'),5'-bisphosphate nucleotidase [Calditrichota bacterium]HQV32950.1 3'(2'),5'-bisphosphate nucleotidase [Calditrichia bacterium]